MGPGSSSPHHVQIGTSHHGEQSKNCLFLGLVLYIRCRCWGLFGPLPTLADQPNHPTTHIRKKFPQEKKTIPWAWKWRPFILPLPATQSTSLTPTLEGQKPRPKRLLQSLWGECYRHNHHVHQMFLFPHGMSQRGGRMEPHPHSYTGWSQARSPSNCTSLGGACLEPPQSHPLGGQPSMSPIHHTSLVK